MIPKTDHTWVKDIVKEATATEEGLEREICRDCKEELWSGRETIYRSIEVSGGGGNTPDSERFSGKVIR